MSATLTGIWCFLTSLMLTDANLLSGVFGDIHCYSNIYANILWIMYLFFELTDANVAPTCLLCNGDTVFFSFTYANRC